MATDKTVKMRNSEGIMKQGKYSQGDESYSIAKRGDVEFISAIGKDDRAASTIKNFSLDEVIAHIDTLLSQQLL